jgi:hypothetical protein
MDVKNLFLFFIVLMSFSLVYSYPDIDFNEDSYLSENLSIGGRVSPDLKLSLYLNTNFIDSQDIIVDLEEFSIGGELDDIEVQIGQSFRIINSNSQDVLDLEFTSVTGDLEQERLTINPGASVNLRFNDTGSFRFENLNNPGDTARLYVRNNELVNFSFENMGNVLRDGDNLIKFVLEPFNNRYDILEEEFTVDYDKYSVVIDVYDYNSTTKEDEIFLEGFISDSNSPLYYALNVEGLISNLGVLDGPIDLDGNNFNLTISNLQEGNNTIRFVSLDPQNPTVFNGESWEYVFVDTIPPNIDLLNIKYRPKNGNSELVRDISDFGEGIFINGARVEFNFSVDAVEMNYTFNGENGTCPEIINDSVICDFSLIEGQNNFTFIAKDLPGNTAKESHVIFVSLTDPDLDEDSLSPSELFKGPRETHFFFEQVSGKTEPGNVKLTAFTFPAGSEGFDSQGNGVRITCEDFQSSIFRNLGNSGSRNDDSSLNLDDQQVSISPSLLFQKREVTTDSQGNFEFIIGFQEGDISQSELNSNLNNINNNRSPSVGSVVSDNVLCFFLEDKFGNSKIRSFNVKLDAGNTLWRPGEITTIPNNMYSGEIEMSGDVRSGNGASRFSVIARIQYIGAGKVSSFSNFNVQMDSTDEYSRNARIVSNEMNYVMDSDTNELLVYFPVELRPLDIDPIDYPSSIDFKFQGRLTYTVDDVSIPIDTRNPIYFQTTINIERPLDHSKWLSPQMIEDGIKFLNKSIELTKKASEWMGVASTVSVLACTAAKFKYGIEMAAIQDDPDGSKKEEAKRKMLMICDRAVCTASPKACEGDFASTEEGTPGVLQIPDGKTNLGESDLLEDGFITNQDDKKLAQFESLRLGDSCDYNGDGNSNDGVLISGTVLQYEDQEGIFVSSSQSKSLVRNICVPARKNSAGEVSYVNLNEASGVCFSTGEPKFDETRCNFFGSDGDMGKPGFNPSDNIIESIRCGCVTDTYSHLKNILKVQEGIRSCLEGARIGEVKGSYCERLLSQAICDVATNVVFNTIGQKSTRTGSSGTDTHEDENAFVKALSGAREGDSLLNDRYQGSFYTKAGLSTQQVVNKACIASFSGDWSVLSENILSSIDQNEVEPIFGPMLPESRIIGYNPITGDMSMNYRFTYGVVSGGQVINTRVEFVCDKSKANGDFCPDNLITSSQGGSQIDIKNLYTEKGGHSNDLIVATDTKAKFKYNIIRLTHTYTVKGETKTRVQEETVNHKGDFLLANCHWNGGIFGLGSVSENVGITCDSLFSEDSLIAQYEILDTSKLVPRQGSNVIYYPQNYVLFDLHYRLRGGSSDLDNQANLYYKVQCDNAQGVVFGSKTLTFDSLFGNQLVSLYQLPELGVTADTNEFWSTKGNINLQDGDEIKEIIVRSRSGSEGVIPPSFNIREIYVDGLQQVGRAVVFDINTETGKLNNFAEVLDVFKKLPIRGTEENELRELLELRIDRDVSDIDILIESKNGKQFIFSGFTYNSGAENTGDLDSAQESSCNIKFRLMPLNEGLTSDNFEVLDTQEDRSLFTNANVNGIIKEYPFSFSNYVESTNPFVYEIVSPREDETICWRNGGFEVPVMIAGIFKDRVTLSSEILEFSFDLSMDLYDRRETKKEKLNFNDGIYSKDIIFNLGSSNSDFSGVQDAKLKLSYEQYSMSGNNLININLNFDCREDIIGNSLSTSYQIDNLEDYEITIREFANKENIYFEKLMAIVLVESNGKAFDGDHPSVRFECRRFNNEVVSSKNVPCDTSQYRYGAHIDTNKAAFLRALEIDRNQAILQTSFGLGQVMGFNYQLVGFNNPESFYQAMFSEEQQIEVFLKFILNNDLIRNELKKEDTNWAKIAESYNGEDYAVNSYDIKLQRAYKSLVS